MNAVTNAAPLADVGQGVCKTLRHIDCKGEPSFAHIVCGRTSGLYRV